MKIRKIIQNIDKKEWLFLIVLTVLVIIFTTAPYVYGYIKSPENNKVVKRILVCPLNWGLGHATRCIPIIKALIGNNAEVLIGAEARPLELLKKEFPELTFITFTGYNISYPANVSMVVKILLKPISTNQYQSVNN